MLSCIAIQTPRREGIAFGKFASCPLRCDVSHLPHASTLALAGPRCHSCNRNGWQHPGCRAHPLVARPSGCLAARCPVPFLRPLQRLRSGLCMVGSACLVKVTGSRAADRTHAMVSGPLSGDSAFHPFRVRNCQRMSVVAQSCCWYAVRVHRNTQRAQCRDT